MKRQVAIGLVFLAGCVVGGVSSQVVAPPARADGPGTRWEYFCMSQSAEENSAAGGLNAAGAKGWELVSASPQGQYAMTMTLCMKRQLP
jgi:hypothetical protein